MYYVHAPSIHFTVIFFKWQNTWSKVFEIYNNKYFEIKLTKKVKELYTETTKH